MLVSEGIGKGAALAARSRRGSAIPLRTAHAPPQGSDVDDASPRDDLSQENDARAHVPNDVNDGETREKQHLPGEHRNKEARDDVDDGERDGNHSHDDDGDDDGDAREERMGESGLRARGASAYLSLIGKRFFSCKEINHLWTL